MTEVGVTERQHVSPQLPQSPRDGLGDHRQVACISYDDPPALDPVRLVTQTLVFSHLSNRHTTGCSSREPVEGVSRGTADHAVVRKPYVLLELLNRLVGPGAEDPVDPVWVEAELAELALELCHVITAHHRVAVVEEPITEPMVGFYEGVPGLGTTDPVNHQATVALKPAQRGFGLRTKVLWISVNGVTD